MAVLKPKEIRELNEQERKDKLYELRNELINKGHIFKTNSDTETILHLYEEYGEQAPSYLKGMFGFAIFDSKQQKIFLARDRYGIKPLYYYLDNNNFLFGSEIKSILANPHYKKSLDNTGVESYFSFGYIPSDLTLFGGIKKIPPASHATFHSKCLEFSTYWDYESHIDYSLTEVDYVDSFLEKFSSAVERHLISDVPLGAFLSGGIDSSIVVAMMNKFSSDPIETFSIGYGKGGSEFDERGYAEIIAKKFNTNHHVFELDASIIHLLYEIINKLEQPVGDASIIPNYFLSFKVKEYVTVALSGLGGDELCGGYERYLGTLLANYYNRLPLLLRKQVLPNLVKLLPDSKKGRHFQNRLKRFIEYAHLPTDERYFRFISKFNSREKSLLFNTDFYNENTNSNSDDIFHSYWNKFRNQDELLRLLAIDMNMYIPDDLLLLSDSMSMAASLEVRVPFLDHEIVEFFWNIPSNLKIKGLNKKYLLKKAAEKLIPKEVIYRPKKGFSVPLTVWFRNELRSFVEEHLYKDSISAIGIFNYEYIRKILDEHYRGYANHDEKIFTLLVFVIWYKNNIENSRSL